MSLLFSRSIPVRQASPLTYEVWLILLLALGFRLLTYNGAFGSDDLVYFNRAAQLAQGNWSSANYNGALRYGFNLPAAGFIALFGPSLFVANLWSLSCSLIEVGAVFLFANSVMNRRAARFAALLLASAPLHMAVATRIHADPVVSMFVTLSFVLLYFGLLRRQPLLLLCCGLALGGIFWSKELAAVTWFALLPMLWFFRGRWRDLGFVVAGVVLMLLLHGALMWLIAGDPLHLVNVVLSAVKRNFVDGGQGEDSATYYLKYLFLDLRHVGLLAFLALASVYAVPPWQQTAGQERTGYVFTLLWWLGLLAVLSLFPVSLSPLRLPMKQSNYITLFLAPMAVLAGLFVATLPRRAGQWTLAVSLGLGLALGALQQADYRAFTANTKALATFAAAHPQDVIVGSTNNSALGGLWAAQTYPGQATAPILSFRDLNEHASRSQQQLQAAQQIYAVLDPQTLLWFAGPSPVTQPRPCWGPPLHLLPSELGLGNQGAQLALVALGSLKMAAAVLTPLAQPRPSEIYLVNGLNVLCDKK